MGHQVASDLSWKACRSLRDRMGAIGSLTTLAAEESPAFLVDHACQVCGSRIVKRNALFLCPTCEASGPIVTDICGCGLRAHKSERPLPTSLRSAFKCEQNPARSPASPARIAILFGATAAAGQAPRNAACKKILPNDSHGQPCNGPLVPPVKNA
jgi:hypothetical protein